MQESLRKKKVIKEDTLEQDIVDSIKDVLVYLHSSGENKIPTRVVFNEFKKRGIEISYNELQRLFSQNSDFIKEITPQYIEFGSKNKYSYDNVEFNKDLVSSLAMKAAKNSLKN